MAVNNNAAAVLVMLSALAGGKRAAVSRGELVEIGGGFRVPDIMARSGATLLEVGTTNKTRIADYEHAVLTRGAEVLLKVHTSNYEIVGFTQGGAPRRPCSTTWAAAPSTGNFCPAWGSAPLWRGR